MSFLSPWTLIGLAFLSLPVIIHLLVRRDSKRLDFPSLRFLRETPSFRLRPRRVRQPLLLALRLAALALLIFGLARPLVYFNSKPTRTHLILLDASLSMNGRTAAATEQARNIINQLRAGERAAIISFASEARVLSEATSDKNELTSSLEKYSVTGGAADYEAGLRRAQELMRSAPPGESLIELVSDFQQSGLAQLPATSDPKVLTAARIIVHPVGARLERNAYITDEAVAWSERGVEVSATEIVAASDGRSAVRKVFALDAQSGARPDATWRREANGQITATLRALAADDFDADDERFLVFDEPRAGRVLLIEQEGGGENLYLRAALESAADETAADRFALEKLATLPAEVASLQAFALVVYTLHKQPSVADVRTLSEFARAGGKVFLCVAPDADTAAWNALAQTVDGAALPFASLARKASEAQNSRFGTADSDAPVLRGVSDGVFDALRMTRMRAGYDLTPRDGSFVLMRWNDEAPALVEKGTGRGSMTLLATSPEPAAGDLGASPAFPALVKSITSASLAPRELLSYVIGQAIELNLPAETQLKITDAFGHTRQALARELMQHPEEMLMLPGIYSIDTTDSMRFVAVNAPDSESETALANADDIARLFNRQTEAQTTGGGAAWLDAAERRGNLWRCFLGAALLLLIAELFVSLRNLAGGVPVATDEEPIAR